MSAARFSSTIDAVLRKTAAMIEMDITQPDALQRAMAFHQAGRLVEAEQLYKAVLNGKRDHPAALHMLGLIEFQRGRSETAIRLIDEALAIRPDYAEALTDRGNILCALDRLQEALACYDQALATRPNHANALYNRGYALQRLDRQEEALGSYDRALAINPQAAEVYNNRGNALFALHRFQEALESYDRAIAINPRYTEAMNNRGTVLNALKRPQEALQSYDQVLAINPNHIDALYNRGNVLKGLKRLDEALASYDRALAIKPDYIDAFYHRGNLLYDMGRWQAARESYSRALAIKPGDAAIKFALCVAELPILYSDETEIAQQREAYAERLKALCHGFDCGAAGDLAETVGLHQPFYLAYQGYNDRALQARYGSLVCRIMAARYPPASLPPPLEPDEPVRVGIVSGFFQRSSVLKFPLKGWLTQLDRRHFRLFGYHTGVEQDEETKIAVAICNRFVQGPMSMDDWRQTIITDAPHVLLYPEVGMNSTSAALAAQRLAAVQCNGCGHPWTSGYPTLDYFLTSDLMEPADGQQHYTERLIRLPNLGAYYEQVESLPVPLNRAELGLRDSATIYWCGQFLCKYLPQHDEVFARIARHVGDCQFVFIRLQRGANINELFKQRLERAFAAVGLRANDYCVFLPRMDFSRFSAIFGLCDVFLDSIGWSGHNTTLESLPYGLPIVTVAAPLMRGRHSTGILKMMGVTETITETIDDYVSVAVRLARNVPWRMAVKRRILGNKHKVYRDRACIVALEEFLNRVTRGEKGAAS